MILVTVGAQMPFDRLIEAVDAWAGRHGRSDVLAQVGKDSTYAAQHIETVPFLAPNEFDTAAREARAIVAHAGMGTILTGLKYGKPLIVMPRKGALRETRNDHQIATARRFLEHGMLHVAFEAEELPELLDSIDTLPEAIRIREHASPDLIQAIKNFLHNEHVHSNYDGLPGGRRAA